MSKRRYFADQVLIFGKPDQKHKINPWERHDGDVPYQLAAHYIAADDAKKHTGHETSGAFWIMLTTANLKLKL